MSHCKYIVLWLAALLPALVHTSSLKAQPLIRQARQLLKETPAGQDDLPASEYLQEQLRPIRANFKRINSTTRWTRTIRKTTAETGEGGYATFYYRGRQLEKIVSRQFGETFQQLDEYYLLKGQLSFVLERSYQYNRPIYYDSTAMKAQNDTEVFDIDQSEIEENRSYFSQDKLLHLVNNQDCGAPWASDFLKEEEQRILAGYRKLIQLK